MAETAKIRNVGIVGHRGAGKTTLVDAILFAVKATNRFGRVEEGTSTTDFNEDEKARGMSISLGLAYCDWQNIHFNLIDTPGYGDFTGEVLAGLRVADGAVVVVNATAGVEVETERVWHYADTYGLPRLVFVNKMDGERADFERVLNQLRQQLGARVAPVHLPLGAESQFRGFVDLIRNRAFIAGERPDGLLQEIEVPAEVEEAVNAAREQLMEGVAEADDALLEKYLEEMELSPQEIQRGLQLGTRQGQVVPVLCGAAAKNIGTHSLLEYIAVGLPSPADRGPVEGHLPGNGGVEVRRPEEDSPFSALVFKTFEDRYGTQTYFRVFSGRLTGDTQVYNSSQGQRERFGQIFYMRGKEQSPVSPVVAGDIAAVTKLNHTHTGDTLCLESAPIVYPPISFPEPTLALAIHPRSRGDEDRINDGLARLMEEDRSLQSYRDPDTGELIIAGLGDLHLQVVVNRLREKFGVDVETSLPQVAYRETIRKTVEDRYRHKKQTGGAGQFGEVALRISPRGRGEGYEFIDQIVGGVVPQQYRPSGEKGVRRAMMRGPLAGYPVVDVSVVLFDGKDHPVDSSDIAFQLAGEQCFAQAVQKADPVLLEPIYNLEVFVPEELMGSIMGDLSGRRARILGQQQVGSMQRIDAQVPLREILDYANVLQSMTSGRGTHRKTFSHYEEMPGHLSQEVIAERRRREEGK